MISVSRKQSEISRSQFEPGKFYALADDYMDWKRGDVVTLDERRLLFNVVRPVTQFTGCPSIRGIELVKGDSFTVTI